MDLDDYLLWIGPLLIGLIAAWRAVDGLARRRVFPSRSSDPATAIYRAAEPAHYWALVVMYFAFATLMFALAGFFFGL